MNNPAYDSGYLNSAKLSGRYLFKLIARNCSDCFGIIYKYMKSDYRRYMDMGNPLYLCKTPKQIMGNMGITVDLNAVILMMNLFWNGCLTAILLCNGSTGSGLLK